MSSKKTNSEQFWDFLNRWFLWILVVILVPIIRCDKTHAKCLIHQVQSGDTLAKIAIQYHNDINKWQDIKRDNQLKHTKIDIGQKLDIYIPDARDWQDQCINILFQAYSQIYSNTQSIGIVEDIANGIAYAGINILNYTPSQMFEACYWAATTAKQESLFRFAIGGAGEIGMYQFKLNTIRLTGKQYKIKQLATGSDKYLVEQVMDPMYATVIFLLHYDDLYKEYKSSVFHAWKRYNNGSEADAYASKAVRRYKDIKEQLTIIPCSLVNRK